MELKANYVRVNYVRVVWALYLVFCFRFARAKTTAIALVVLPTVIFSLRRDIGGSFEVKGVRA